MVNCAGLIHYDTDDLLSLVAIIEPQTIASIHASGVRDGRIVRPFYLFFDFAGANCDKTLRNCLMVMGMMSTVRCLASSTCDFHEL